MELAKAIQETNELTETRAKLNRAVNRGVAYMAAVEQLFGADGAERVAELAEKFEQGLTNDSQSSH